eukprot:GHVT01021540.1.p1 GENE.GHVT01021540.1~~GHVT01021540.1.p1  ORF type:complete len:111 (+),score=25.42 GHVT01021540.1:77-409(+)
MSVAASGISVGLKRGYLVTKRPLTERPSRRKGRLSPRTRLVREVIREVAGFAPYERRIMELLKIGTAATEKKALKFAKKRLGTHKRGKAKRAELHEAVIAIRKKAAAAGH